MTRAGRSLAGFGAYRVFMGLWFAVAPNAMLTFLLTANTSEHWIRLLGTTAAVLGVWMITAGRAGLVPFARLSQLSHLSIMGAFTTFVVLGLAPPLLLGIVGNEALGLLWTTLALRADDRAGAH